ncbi:hypothetical protein Tsubulata_039570 [Turnera subulata]|uniref:Uncharacterized protein n=1 Tax=Turnera subulata TaxID=218843 RepID=A0A9Q0FLA2_9ROSI|nr:hypothetical protein Tsubulata_039570 [Turnera subulata]
MSGAFARGAHTINSMFFKPMARKSYHKKSSADSFRETMKVDAEEAKSKSRIGENDGICWVPHEGTGIFYPKGQEKVMEGIPPTAGRDVITVNWFSQNDHTCI